MMGTEIRTLRILADRGGEEPPRFAAQELARCLERMRRVCVPVEEVEFPISAGVDWRVAWMRARRSSAGSSLGSWGTSSLRKALASMDWSSDSFDVSAHSMLNAILSVQFNSPEAALRVSRCSARGAIGNRRVLILP